MGDAGPYGGLLVVDLGQFVVVPVCAQHLADGGARVVKVEPVSGDAYRQAFPVAPGESRFYLAKNRGKESIALDLGSAAGREVVERLVARADVVLTNMSPGALERHRLRWEDLSALNPHVVYGVVSAFGHHGPEAARTGMDVVAQARSGLMWALGATDDDGVPLHSEVQAADYATSLLLLSGVSAALLARERDPQRRGQKVEVSLLGGAFALQGNALHHLYEHDAWREEFVERVLPELRARGAAPAEVEAARTALRPDVFLRAGYRVLRTADGYVAVGAGGRVARARFVTAIGLGELAGAEDSDETVAAIDAAVRALDTAALIERLDACDVPVSAVRHVEEMLFDPHVEAEGLLADLEHETAGRYRSLVAPIGLSATPFRPAPASPAFARDTRKVLSEVGYTDEEIDELIASGVAADHWPPPR
jgi:crotonobetainyl-CoA:carnitine CoA-transferase CaiB-like acyl-CoA transferase